MKGRGKEVVGAMVDSRNDGSIRLPSSQSIEVCVCVCERERESIR